MAFTDFLRSPPASTALPGDSWAKEPPPRDTDPPTRPKPMMTPDRAQVLAACVTAAAAEARGEAPERVADHAWCMFTRLVDHAAGRVG